MVNEIETWSSSKETQMNKVKKYEMQSKIENQRSAYVSLGSRIK